jgi:hypothetical protein
MLQEIQTKPRTKSTPPPVLLCAWIRNPSTSQQANKPRYIRAEIITVNQNVVIAREYGTENYFETTRADVKKVHTINANTGETWQILGDPKPC